MQFYVKNYLLLAAWSNYVARKNTTGYVSFIVLKAEVKVKPIAFWDAVFKFGQILQVMNTSHIQNTCVI